MIQSERDTTASAGLGRKTPGGEDAGRGHRHIGGAGHDGDVLVPPARGRPAPAGEPYITTGTDDCQYGLSPRLRGNLRGSAHLPPVNGSIPAPAGEPLSPISTCQACAVYPRACGGTIIHNVICEPLLGLSPRLRGNPSLAFRWKPPTKLKPR